MARRGLITLTVGVPLSVVALLKPVHVGGALLGYNCGPALRAANLRASPAGDDRFGINGAYVTACHQAGAPWVASAGVIFLATLVLAFLLRRRRSSYTAATR